MNEVQLIVAKRAQITRDDVLTLSVCRDGPDGRLLGQARPDLGESFFAQSTYGIHHVSAHFPVRYSRLRPRLRTTRYTTASTIMNSSTGCTVIPRTTASAVITRATRMSNST